MINDDDYYIVSGDVMSMDNEEGYGEDEVDELEAALDDEAEMTDGSDTDSEEDEVVDEEELLAAEDDDNEEEEEREVCGRRLSHNVYSDVEYIIQFTFHSKMLQYSKL